MTALRPRRSLTLIELTVVLLILAATAGILVPRLTGYGERAHGATAAATIQEASKALALFEANQGRFPDRWDTLIDVAGGGGTGLASTLVETGVTPVLVAGTLTAGEATALQAAGITNLFAMDTTETGFDATFQPYDGGATPSATAVADGTPVATVPYAAIGLPTPTPGAGKLIALGLGAQCEVFGNTAVNVPLVYEGSIAPNEVYLRYIGVFEVSDGDGAREKARFVGLLKVEPADGSVVGADEHLRVYYESRGQ